jgi:uncharacterized iron-regulated protein
MKLTLARLLRPLAALALLVMHASMASAQSSRHPLCAEADSTSADAKTVCALVDARSGTPGLVEGNAVDALVAAAAEIDIVVLGEVHDNPIHHALRGTVIGRLAKLRQAAGRPKPAVVFEHIRTDQQPALDRFAELQRDAEGRGTADDLLGFLDWDATGWPSQSMFKPLFTDVLQAHLPIVAGDAARDDIRKVARQGVTALDASLRERLKIADPLPAPLSTALMAELKISHCGLVPEAALKPMLTAQRYRDAHLADAVARAADTHGAAFLLTGNGHVRKDRAAPYYLAQMAPARKVLTVVLMEVQDGKPDAAAYVPRDPDGKPAADLVVLTPPAEREDPCEGLRKRMARPKAPEPPAASTPKGPDSPAAPRTPP